VIEGDAYDLAGTLGKRGDKVSAVVSSLPLVARPMPERVALIEAGLDRIPCGKPFIQFSYLRNGPVEAPPGRFTAEASRWIWMNLPPARVWLYRRPL
jgi:phosphatidylethanolamine/phosphatidyl-N-methylethanolamine N-methyltransferase